MHSLIEKISQKNDFPTIFKKNRSNYNNLTVNKHESKDRKEEQKHKHF